jgi:hypothetical protein
MEHAHHAVVADSNHPRPVRTPRNLRDRKALLERQVRVTNDLVMLLQPDEVVAEIVLALRRRRD